MRAGKANSLQYDANTHALSNFLSNMAAAVCEDLYSSSSDDEEILLFLLLLRRRRRRSIAANRMIWTKRWILRRRMKAACENIVRELNIEDPEKFRQYHRLDRVSFEEILTLVSPLIERKDTHLRCSLEPRERLSVTLRFLAIGMSLHPQYI